MAEMSGYMYQCSAGETFDSVALQIYDDEKYACDLMNANPHLVTKSVFDGTESLFLPVVEIKRTNGKASIFPLRPHGRSDVQCRKWANGTAIPLSYRLMSFGALRD